MWIISTCSVPIGPIECHMTLASAVCAGVDLLDVVNVTQLEKDSILVCYDSKLSPFHTCSLLM